MKRAEHAAFLLIAAIVVYQSMIPPVVSIGNNGDFGKISGHFSIGYPPELEGRYAPLKFLRQRRYLYHPEYRTTENLLAAGAMGLSSLVSKSGEFDIRCIGAIHAAIFLWAMWLLLPVLAHFFDPRFRWLILLAIAIVLGDVMYVSVFNSFYTDAATLVFVPLTVVFFLRGLLWRRAWDLIGLALSSLFLVGSKPQHAILAIPVIALFFAWRKRWVAPVFHPVFHWLAASVVLLSAAYTTRSVPRDYARNPIYNTIFIGLLPHSPDPSADLAEFGLEPADVAYLGTSGFHATGGFSNPQFTERFRRVGTATLLRFYAYHPVRAIQLLARNFGEAGETRPLLGNFDPAEGFPPYYQSQAFALWSRLRTRFFARQGWRFLWFTIALQAVFLVRALRAKSGSPWKIGALWISIAVMLEAAVSGFGDVVEAARHFTIFMEMQDVTLLILFASLLPQARKDPT